MGVECMVYMVKCRVHGVECGTERSCCALYFILYTLYRVRDRNKLLCIILYTLYVIQSAEQKEAAHRA